VIGINGPTTASTLNGIQVTKTYHHDPESLPRSWKHDCPRDMSRRQYDSTRVRISGMG